MGRTKGCQIVGTDFWVLSHWDCLGAGPTHITPGRSQLVTREETGLCSVSVLGGTVGGHEGGGGGTRGQSLDPHGVQGDVFNQTLRAKLVPPQASAIPLSTLQTSKPTTQHPCIRLAVLHSGPGRRVFGEAQGCCLTGGARVARTEL